MKTEKVKSTKEIKSNIEVGTILIREINPSIKYRVVYISKDNEAILVSQQHADTTAIIDLTNVKSWLKVIDSIYK